MILCSVPVGRQSRAAAACFNANNTAGFNLILIVCMDGGNYHAAGQKCADDDGSAPHSVVYSYCCCLVFIRTLLIYVAAGRSVT